jgi:hypothetical protein
MVAFHLLDKVMRGALISLQRVLNQLKDFFVFNFPSDLL